MMSSEVALSQPMVSAVLVNWNRAADILDNIRWLRNQTWSNLEIIVVDNGSRDEANFRDPEWSRRHNPTEIVAVRWTTNIRE
jgi:GT2 family glycosyltransferase